MRRFRRREGISDLALPGIGRVRSHHILEGDQWARYCPEFLVEILDSTPVESQPVLTEPRPDPIARVAEKTKASKAQPKKAEPLLEEKAKDPEPY